MRSPTARQEKRATSGSMAHGAALQQLQAQWPGRQEQLAKLWEYLSARTARRPLLIHGGPSTGKTGLVRSILEARRQPHAYINAVETAKPKPIARSILEQLKGKPRQRGSGYVAETRCEGMDAFAPALEVTFPSGGPLACVVIDSAEQLPPALLASLAACSGANVAWLLLSQLAPGTGAFQTGMREMPAMDALAFDGYTRQTLAKVLAPWQPADDAAQRLLGNQLPSLQRVSRSAEDIQLALRHVHAHRARRAASQGLAAGPATPAATPSREQPGLPGGGGAAAAAEQGREGAAGGGAAAAGDAPASRSQGGAGSVLSPERRQQSLGCRLSLGAGSRRNGLGGSRRDSLGGERRQSLGGGGRRDSGVGVAAAARDVAEAFAMGMDATAGRGPASDRTDDFELSQFGSVLLVAAYISSRTKEQENRQAFDMRASKRRRTGRLAHDRQMDAAHEARIKERHAFGLERLLALFWSLLEQQELLAGAELEDDRSGAPLPAAQLQSAEVLVQVASLASLRLLSPGSGDPLRGVKYTCNVTDDLARKTAARLGLQLQNYVQ